MVRRVASVAQLGALPCNLCNIFCSCRRVSFRSQGADLALSAMVGARSRRPWSTSCRALCRRALACLAAVLAGPALSCLCLPADGLPMRCVRLCRPFAGADHVALAGGTRPAAGESEATCTAKLLSRATASRGSPPPPKNCAICSSSPRSESRWRASAVLTSSIRLEDSLLLILGLPVGDGRLAGKLLCLSGPKLPATAVQPPDPLLLLWVDCRCCSKTARDS